MDEPAYYKTTYHVAFLGHVIKKLREAKGLTQRELARNAIPRGEQEPISYSTVSYAESGKRVMSEKILTAIADGLGIEPRMLYTLGIPTHPRLTGRKPVSEIHKEINEKLMKAQNLVIGEWLQVDLNALVDDYMKSKARER